MSRRGERPMVPKAEFRSYYGLPVLNQPVWKVDIPIYFFLGGLAGASSVLAAGGHATGRDALGARTKTVAVGAIGLGAVALVHDLGRPSRFANMLRVFKLSSPMSVGSWLLAVYGPMTGVAALSSMTGRLRRLGGLATAAAGVLGPAVATYTAALVADTAVPAWHDAYPEMPFLFAGSSALAAGGLGLVLTPSSQAAPALRMATLGAATELAASTAMERRLGQVAEPYSDGKAGRFMKAGKLLAVLGVLTAWLGRRRRPVAAAAGTAMAAGSLCTRLGVFEAGRQSAADPRATIEPQRARVITSAQ